LARPLVHKPVFHHSSLHRACRPQVDIACPPAMPALPPQQAKAVSTEDQASFLSHTFKGKVVPPQSGNGSVSFGVKKKGGKAMAMMQLNKKKKKMAKRGGIGPERNRIPWSVYLKKLAKQTTESLPEVKVKSATKDAINILNSMAADVITRLAKEAKGVTVNTETRQLNAKAIYAAAKLMMTPEMNDKACLGVSLTMREFADSVQQAKVRREQTKQEGGSRPQPEQLKRHRDRKREIKERRVEMMRKRHGGLLTGEQEDEVAGKEQAEPVMSPASVSSVSSAGKLRRLRKAEDLVSSASTQETLSPITVSDKPDSPDTVIAEGPTPPASPEVQEVAPVRIQEKILGKKDKPKYSPDSEGTTAAPGSSKASWAATTPSHDGYSTPRSMLPKIRGQPQSNTSPKSPETD